MSRLQRRKKVDDADDGSTIGIAIGLGVGVPVLITLLVMSWLWVRHRKKLKAEDAEHNSIDFNGDVSFGIKDYPRQRWEEEDQSTNQPGNMSVASFGSMNMANPKTRQNHQIVPLPQLSTFDDGSSTYLYTPHLGQGDASDYSRTLNNVYGPSPNYPSTEKLRHPSGFFAHRVNSMTSTLASTMGGPPSLVIPGTPVKVLQSPSMPPSPSPFDTPKMDRHSSFDDLPSAGGEHPYRQYARDQIQAPFSRDKLGASKPLPPLPVSEYEPEPGRKRERDREREPEPESEQVREQKPETESDFGPGLRPENIESDSQTGDGHRREESESFFDFETPPAPGSENQ